MTRPWIMPADVKQYSEHSSVINKSETKLTVMISLAESKIIKYCHHDFTDEKYTVLPTDVKNAVLILADALSYNDSLRATGKLKSETYDDYSYSVDVNEIDTDFDSLDITSLLNPYVIDESGGNLYMRMGVI